MCLLAAEKHAKLDRSTKSSDTRPWQALSHACRRPFVPAAQTGTGAGAQRCVYGLCYYLQSS